MNGEIDNSSHFTEMETCRKHPDQMLIKYCSVCSELVCKTCISGLHRRHRADDIENIIGERRQELAHLQEEIYNTRLPNLTTIMKTVKKIQEDNDKDREKAEDAIRQRSEQLKDAIEQITNKCIEETKIVRDKRESILRKTISELEVSLKELEFCVERSRNALASNNEMKIIRAAKQIKSQTEMIGSSASVPSLIPLHFSAGKLSSKSIDANFGFVSGDVHTTTFDHFETLTSRKFSKSSINFVYPRVNEAWVNLEDSNNLNLVGIDGHVKMTLEMKITIEGMAVLPNGNIVSSVPERKSIVARSKDGTMTELFTTKPLKPWGLCLAQNGDILVCLFQELVGKETSHRRRLVQRCLQTGQVITTMEYEDGLNIFNLPYRVREGCNGDIAVVDVMSKESARIVALEKSGKVKFIYDGARSVNLSAKFNPYDVCFDSINNIFVADKESKTVQMLDTDGFCLMLFMSLAECFPTCLGSSADGTIWTGYNDGKIEVWRPKYHAVIYHHDE